MGKPNPAHSQLSVSSPFQPRIPVCLYPKEAGVTGRCESLGILSEREK